MERTVLVEMEKLGNLNSGLGQFCFHLGSAFTTIQPKELNLKFYLPARHDQIFGSSFDYIHQKPLHKFLRVNSSGMDIWHCTHQLSKYLPSSKKTKLILTVHDLNFLRKYTGIKRGLYLKTLQRKINRAAAIAVISKFTEVELREHLLIPDIPVKLIYIGTSLKKFDHPLKPGFIPAGKSVFNGGWGAWEGVLRFSSFNLDDGNIKGGSYWRLTPMVNWYMSKVIRMEFIYGYGQLNRFELKGNTQFFQSRIQFTIM